MNYSNKAVTLTSVHTNYSNKAVTLTSVHMNYSNKAVKFTSAYKPRVDSKNSEGECLTANAAYTKSLCILEGTNDL